MIRADDGRARCKDMAYKTRARRSWLRDSMQKENRCCSRGVFQSSHARLRCWTNPWSMVEPKIMSYCKHHQHWSDLCRLRFTYIQIFAHWYLASFRIRFITNRSWSRAYKLLFETKATQRKEKYASIEAFTGIRSSGAFRKLEGLARWSWFKADGRLAVFQI